MNKDRCGFLHTVFAVFGTPNSDDGGADAVIDFLGALVLVVLGLSWVWLGYSLGFSPETEAAIGGGW